jgi:hypothetical protein
MQVQCETANVSREEITASIGKAGISIVQEREITLQTQNLSKHSDCAKVKDANFRCANDTEIAHGETCTRIQTLRIWKSVD